MGQNQWYHVGVGAPPLLVCFSGDWDVHWGYGVLTHGRCLPGWVGLGFGMFFWGCRVWAEPVGGGGFGYNLLVGGFGFVSVLWSF